ncbi:hypothetical protein HPB50_003165 [Hyalomma asiaticum]|uniref:Uncharacterized protein n=1 Tax=Hyalomma asiaticum TaxID=266040 RepID=A0ACB7T517_HYAAI|nr:hypothetical protein HPB50_003165 [Hyalomma asiaticum]
MAYSGGRKVQTSTPPDLTRVRPSVSTDHKSTSNNVSRADNEGVPQPPQPQSPRPRSQFTPPMTLFQDSWAALNDYCVVKQFGTPREKMTDLGEAFIEALSELLQMLRHEAIPEDKTWNVELQEMVDFLVNPDNK